MPARTEWKGLDEDLKDLLQPYEVVVSAPYASYVEYGTDPHPVSQEGVKNLTEWAHLRLSLSYEEAEKVAYAVASKIRTQGTDPQPFFRPAIDEIEDMISAGAFNEDDNPIKSIARELAMIMVSKINDNGTSNTGTLAKSINYAPAESIKSSEFE